MSEVFQQFKKITLADQEVISNFTREFLPYSDYNFTSMWSWNVNDDMAYCWSNGNLVIQFADYVTGVHVYSLLGNQGIEDTVRTLFTMLAWTDRPQELKLVPEIAADQLTGNGYAIEEDRDNFDYIYEIDLLCTFAGNKFETQRNLVNRLHRRYQEIESKEIVSISETDARAMVHLFDQWETSRGLQLPREREAILRLLALPHRDDMVVVGLYLKSKLVAYTISEVVTGKYAITHFAKADTQYAGIYAVLMQSTATLLKQRGCRYLNYEQDIGIPELRAAKTAFRPAFYLKKFIIRNPAIDTLPKVDV